MRSQKKYTKRFMANKILVTGGAGYIGSHTLIELLQTTDFQVYSVDSYINSNESTYDRIERITGQKPNYAKLDLCDKQAVAEYFKANHDFVGVIHFAALKAVGESVENPFLYYQNNLESLNNLLEVCKEYEIKNIIFSSSCSVYGNADELPVTEATPFKQAESPYAHTKQIGEEMLKMICSITSLRSIALRYFNPVGAHISGLNGELPINKPNNLVPVITQTAIGKIQQMAVHGGDYETRDGSCIRDYIHVSDIADAHVKAMQHLLAGKQASKFEIYNLGTGNGVSVLEAIYAFEKVAQTRLNYIVGPRRPGDVVSIYSNSLKAETSLGWTPKYGIEEMMASAWMWEQNIK